MSRPAFYNDNRFRAYPFIEPAEGLPTELVVDFGAIILAGSRFDSARDNIVLQRIWRDGNDLYFDFRSTAPGMEGWQLVFERSLLDPLYRVSFSQARPIEDFPCSGQSSSSLSSSAGPEPSSPPDSSPPAPGSQACDTEPPWEGFLVTGDLSRLAELLASCQSLEGPWTVEPSRITNLSQSYVRTVRVVNAERTRATAPESCFDYCYPFPRYEHYVVCDCLTGYLHLDIGHNVEVFGDPPAGGAVIEARPGAGLGEVCEQIPIFPGEAPPANRSTLDGALDCTEVVLSINGVSRRFFTLLAGPGVVITSKPEEHKVIIDVSMADLALCPDLPEPESSLALPPEEPC